MNCPTSSTFPLFKVHFHHDHKNEANELHLDQVWWPIPRAKIQHEFFDLEVLLSFAYLWCSYFWSDMQMHLLSGWCWDWLKMLIIHQQYNQEHRVMDPATFNDNKPVRITPTEYVKYLITFWELLLLMVVLISVMINEWIHTNATTQQIRADSQANKQSKQQPCNANQHATIQHNTSKLTSQPN